MDRPYKRQCSITKCYINWEDFKTKLKEGNETAWLEFDKITSEVAREYGKDIEKECKEESYSEGYRDAEDDMADEVSDLKDEVRTLEEQLETCGERIVYLEELLDDNEINYAG